VSEANTYANANSPAASAVVHIPPTSGSHMGDPTAVEVVLTRSLPKYFIGILYGGAWTVTARAVAVRSPGLCGLYVLDSTANSALSGTGTAVVNVDACVQVNSSANPAAKMTGSAQVHGTNVFVNGTCSGPAGAFTPACSHVAPVPDPLASIATPPSPGLPPAGQTGCTAPPVNCAFSNSTNHTISPGVYNKIDNTNTGNLTLNPGTYFITTELKNNNTGRLVGAGVFLYFTCAKATAPYWQPCSAAGQSGGSLQLTGPSGFDISAPTFGTYKGLLVFYDRNNTSVLSLTGSSLFHTSGTIYAARAPTTLTGSSSGNGSFASLMVVGTLSLTGSSSVPIHYDPSLNVDAAGVARVSLKE